MTSISQQQVCNVPAHVVLESNQECGLELVGVSVNDIRIWSSYVLINVRVCAFKK